MRNFTVRLQNVPLNSTTPYNLQADSLEEAIRLLRRPNTYPIFILDNRDKSVHYGNIKIGTGDLIGEHTLFYEKNSFFHQESDEYKTIVNNLPSNNLSY